MVALKFLIAFSAMSLAAATAPQDNADASIESRQASLSPDGLLRHKASSLFNKFVRDRKASQYKSIPEPQIFWNPDPVCSKPDFAGDSAGWMMAAQCEDCYECNPNTGKPNLLFQKRGCEAPPSLSDCFEKDGAPCKCSADGH